MCSSLPYGSHGHPDRAGKGDPQTSSRGKERIIIGRLLEVPVTSVSRSITSMKRKARDVEEDIAFMVEIKHVSIDKGRIRFLTSDRDPKAIRKVK
jgi:hypothetical protein